MLSSHHRPNVNVGSGNIARPRRRTVVSHVGQPRPGLGRGFNSAPPTPRAGAPTPAPPPAPAAPAPSATGPTGAGFVPDYLYNSAINTAQHNYDLKIGSINEAERRTKFDFGIDDPTNPNSRMAGLKRAFLARRKTSSVELAAGGHLYSGAHQRGQEHALRDEGFADAALRQQYQDLSNGYINQRKQAGIDKETAGTDAFAAWIERQPPAEVALNPAATTTAAPTPPRSTGGHPQPTTSHRPSRPSRPHGHGHRGSAPNRNQGSGNTRRRRH